MPGCVFAVVLGILFATICTIPRDREDGRRSEIVGARYEAASSPYNEIDERSRRCRFPSFDTRRWLLLSSPKPSKVAQVFTKDRETVAFAQFLNKPSPIWNDVFEDIRISRHIDLAEEDSSSDNEVNHVDG